jgi:hypothetical protein
MPKIEIDYSNTIIYKITCTDESISDKYVGHTTNFVQRKYAHKNNCSNDKSSNYKCKLYKTIRDHGGWSNWKMEIIKIFNCIDHDEAIKKEQECIMLYNANLNSIEELSNKNNISPEHNENDNLSINITPISHDTFPFECNICDYVCSKKQHLVQHFKTSKHILNNKHLVSKNGNHWKPSQAFGCECGKCYANKSGLWKHKKTCNYGLAQNSEADKIKEVPSTKEIIDLMRLQMIENLELRKIMIEQQKQIIELASKTSIINTNTNTNTNCINMNNSNNNNNTFNLQLFLNEQCKDALNINEFVDTIKMKLTDLENFGHLGYVEGVSRIFIKGLNELHAFKRPIHCSDLKREVLYIKDNNCWKKETDDKPVLKNAIKQVANKNIKQIQSWKDNHPECTESHSKKNDQYIKIVMNSMSGGTSEEQHNNISQIVKNVAKVVTIEKNNEKTINY